jgi:hypothetical protein
MMKRRAHRFLRRSNSSQSPPEKFFKLALCRPIRAVLSVSEIAAEVFCGTLVLHQDASKLRSHQPSPERESGGSPHWQMRPERETWINAIWKHIKKSEKRSSNV